MPFRDLEPDLSSLVPGFSERAVGRDPFGFHYGARTVGFRCPRTTQLAMAPGTAHCSTVRR